MLKLLQNRKGYSMKTNLNDEMKRTLFDISLSHMQKQKTQLTQKSASRILINYKKALYSNSKISVSSQLCEEFSVRFKKYSPQEIITWLDTIFVDNIPL